MGDRTLELQVGCYPSDALYPLLWIYNYSAEDKQKIPQSDEEVETCVLDAGRSAQYIGVWIAAGRTTWRRRGGLVVEALAGELEGLGTIVSSAADSICDLGTCHSLGISVKNIFFKKQF